MRIISARKVVLTPSLRVEQSAGPKSNARWCRMDPRFRGDDSAGGEYLTIFLALWRHIAKLPPSDERL